MPTTNKNSQKLTICLIAETKDSFGVIEVSIKINGKDFTYPITSEFALRKFKSLLRRHKPGKALHLLKLFTVKGFNSFKEGEV